MKRVFILLLLSLTSCIISAQPVCKDVLKINRDKLYRNIVNNSISANLSIALTDSTEENWQDAFWAIQLINYRSPWSDNKIHAAFNDAKKRSISFQRSLLDVGCAVFPEIFYQQVRSLLLATNDANVFAMCATYIMRSENGSQEKKFLAGLVKQKLAADPGNVILQQLQYETIENAPPVPSIHCLLQKDYLPGKVLMLSFQRKNRDFPGIVLVRDANGNFIKDDSGMYFSVAQLARSLTNMPGYISNGNTPEGIFRMDGFDISKSNFIGPTSNIQLTMPFEYRSSHFYNDLSLEDTIWNIETYKKLLPPNFKDYYPAYQAFFAGKAGRTAIIAHGSTVNPAFYKGSNYYPLTPTQGCLCTKEVWNESTGILTESDQQKLVDAITRAGGPDGYAIVINIDDKEAPVSINDIVPFLKLAKQ